MITSPRNLRLKPLKKILSPRKKVKIVKDRKMTTPKPGLNHFDWNTEALNQEIVIKETLDKRITPSEIMTPSRAISNCSDGFPSVHNLGPMLTSPFVKK